MISHPCISLCAGCQSAFRASPPFAQTSHQGCGKVPAPQKRTNPPSRDVSAAAPVLQMDPHQELQGTEQGTCLLCSALLNCVVLLSYCSPAVPLLCSAMFKLWSYIAAAAAALLWGVSLSLVLCFTVPLTVCTALCCAHTPAESLFHLYCAVLSPCCASKSVPAAQ